jgi:tetratricopeptide (TPR) repeat protein
MRRFKVADLPEVTSESRGEVERAEAQYWIGKVYLARLNLVDALIHFRKAVELDPRDTLALLEARWQSASRRPETPPRALGQLSDAARQLGLRGARQR